MIAVVWHQFIAQRVEPRWNLVSAIVCGILEKIHNANHDGWGELRIRCYIRFLVLRRNTFAKPDFAIGLGIVERETISLCIERLTDGFGDDGVSGWSDGLNFAALSRGEQRD